MGGRTKYQLQAAQPPNVFFPPQIYCKFLIRIATFKFVINCSESVLEYKYINL